MTLLHQAAQKAVERVRHTLMTGLAHNDAIAALNEIVAMLPQHPDPETRPSMSMFASASDYNAAMDEWLAPPALQQQEVPREPVALERWGRAKRNGSVLLERMADGYWTPWHIAQEALAASPSTTRQQEVGSGYEFAGGFIQNRKANGSTRWEQVSKQYENDADVVKLYRAAAPSTPEKAGGVSEPARGNTTCNPHPDAPHGFNRNASHNAGRYVCDCEGWMPPPPSPIPHPLLAQANDGGEHG